MQLDFLLNKIETFYKIAIANHYPVDMSKAKNILDKYKNYNDRGDHSETMEYAIVPIDNIEKQPIWSQEKLDIVKKRIQEGKFLEPVMLISTPEKPGKLIIDDGVHRVEASRQLGYTNVPALIHAYH